MSTKRSSGKPRFLIRSIRAPIWLLARVRDLYVQNLTGSGGHVVYGNAMGCPTFQIPSSPGRFNVNVNSPASNYRTADKTPAEIRRSKSAVPLGGGGGSAAVAPQPRSRSVGFERIDEDKAFDCGEDPDKIGLLKVGIYAA